MNKPVIFAMFIASTLLFCCAETKVDSVAVSNRAQPTSTAVTKTPSAPADSMDYERVLKGSIGLVVLSDRYESDDYIHIYNRDGNLWLKFIFARDGWMTDTGKLNYGDNGFKPLMLDAEGGNLVLKCAGQDKTRYEVFVDEEKGLKKYVKKDDKALKFQTWEEYALGMFAVGFDEKTNSLREAPHGQEKSDVPRSVKETVFRPVEIKGEWMKVEWDVESKSGIKARKESGWIKWRDSENLLVDLFHSA